RQQTRLTVSERGSQCLECVGIHPKDRLLGELGKSIASLSVSTRELIELDVARRYLAGILLEPLGGDQWVARGILHKLQRIEPRRDARLAREEAETSQHGCGGTDSCKTVIEPLEVMLKVGSQVQRMPLLLASTPRVGG